MALALEQARLGAESGEVPVGAVVVVQGQVIAVGANQPVASIDPTAHAEIRAIRAAAQALGNYRLAGATLYVSLEPCAMCAGAMVLARIERLVFGCADPKGGAVGSLYDIPRDTRLNHRMDVISGVCDAECRRLLQAFFATRRTTR
jgi:tRNA(adenine34) deaminase